MTVLKSRENYGLTVAHYQFQVVENANQTRVEASSQMFTDASKTDDKAQIVTPDEDQLACLIKEVQRLEEELGAAIARSDERYDVGLRAGRDQGLEEAASDNDRKAEILADSAKRAISDALASIEKQSELAVKIARAVLSRILGETNGTSDLVRETAGYWKERLAENMILQIRVSTQDFGEEAALAALRARVGKSNVELDEQLEAGGCIFDLQLGSVDVSIPIQAANADQKLAEFDSCEEVQ